MRRLWQLALLIVVLPALLVQARSTDELIRLATEEALPEVRQAAALALSERWAGSQLSDDDLRQWALESPIPDLRDAAARALGVRLVQRAADLDALQRLTLAGEFEQVQIVAAHALSDALLEAALGLDALLKLLNEAQSPLLKDALVPALTQALVASPKEIRALLAEAAQPTVSQWQQALAQAGLEKLQASTVFALDEAALLAAGAGQRSWVPGEIKGQNPALRSAAGQTYARMLAQTEVPTAALEDLVGDPMRSAAVRAAAAPLLSEAWLNANLPLSTLERHAVGPTPELQGAAVDALVQAYVMAVGRLELTPQDLADSVSAAQSEALALARAQALFVLLRTALVGLAAQADLEAIVNGQVVMVKGVVVDGSLPAVQQAAGTFLTGIYTFFGFIDRFEDPLQDLQAIVTDETLTTAFRQAAGNALQVVFSADRQRSLATLDELRGLLEQLSQALDPIDVDAATASLDAFRRLLDQTLDLLVLTAEVGGDFSLRQAFTGGLNRSLTTITQALEQGRLLTVRSEISKVQQQLNNAQRSVEAAPTITAAELVALAGEGSTPELRQAAAFALSQRLQRDAVPFDALWQLAQHGASLALQLASVDALAQAWSADLDTLYAMSQVGPTEAVRQAAALALVRSDEFSHLRLEDWLALADGRVVALNAVTLDGAVDAVRNAAAAVLSPHFADAALFSLDALIAQAAQGDSDALQWSAAVALQQRLLEANLGESALFRLISEHTLLFGTRPAASEALSFALTQALAAIWANDTVAQGHDQQTLLQS